MPNNEEDRIRGIKELVVRVFEEARPSMIAEVVTHINPRIEALSNDMRRFDDGQKYVIQMVGELKADNTARFNRQDDVTDRNETWKEKELSNIRDMLQTLIGKDARRDGGDDTKKSLYKGAGAVVGIVGGASGLVVLVKDLWHYIWGTK